MEWRPALRRFGVRFGICLVVLGLGYGLVFGFKVRSHHRPQTSSQKRAALRTSLAQVLITDSALVGFKGQGVTVAYDLGQIQSVLQTNTAALQQALQTAPPIKSSLRANVATIIDQQQAANKQFQAASQTLSKLLQYDPSSDLNLAPSDGRLNTRAQAAAAGLSKIAQSVSSSVNSDGSLEVEAENTGVSALLDKATQTALKQQIDCLNQLAQQLTAGQTTQAGQTRDHCVQMYPALRGQAVDRILQTSYSQQHATRLRQEVTPLLDSLDKLSK